MTLEMMAAWLEWRGEAREAELQHMIKQAKCTDVHENMKTQSCIHYLLREDMVISSQYYFFPPGKSLVCFPQGKQVGFADEFLGKQWGRPWKRLSETSF